MTALRIVVLQPAAAALEDQLARADDTPWATTSPGTLTVLLADCVDHAAVDRWLREWPPGLLGWQAGCALVYARAESGALRRLLCAGVGHLIEFGPDTPAVLQACTARRAAIEQALSRPAVVDNLIGRSAVWRSTLATVAETALFSQAALLLTGPTGTGKELLARMLHTLDPRADKGELVVVDCTTLTQDLAGSELFGHERGAYTGAVGERPGAVALADRGTLFLDEVGELPLALQAQFLRVLQEQCYRRVGASRWQRASFRLVCATHRDLLSEVAAGRFRSDLFHRLAANVCHTPALSERVQDIPLLVRHVVAQAAGPRPPAVSPTLMDYLCRRDYAGHVRELVQLVRACLRRHPGAGALTLSCLPEEEIRAWQEVAEASEAGETRDTGTGFEETLGERDSAADAAFDDRRLDAFVRCALQSGLGLKELGRRVEASAVRIALTESDSVTSAASRLGVTPRALHLRRAAERGEAQTGEAEGLRAAAAAPAGRTRPVRSRPATARPGPGSAPGR